MGSKYTVYVLVIVGLAVPVFRTTNAKLTATNGLCQSSTCTHQYDPKSEENHPRCEFADSEYVVLAFIFKCTNNLIDHYCCKKPENAKPQKRFYGTTEIFQRNFIKF